MKLNKGLFNMYASDYAKENKRLDYRGLAKMVGDMILCNNIVEVEPEIFENVHCGSLYYISDDAEDDYKEYVENYEPSEEYNEEPMTYEDWLEENRDDYERMKDIFQYYLVRDTYWLEQCGELVLYSDKLDCYVWCIDHWGTSWDYVLTDIELDEGEE